jgi:N-acetylmuramoyl-L-alanine amidase
MEKLNEKIQIIIDPGHGGAKEKGAIANGFIEKDLNLKVAKLIKSKLSKYFKNLYMTRDSDAYVSLKVRGQYVSSKAENFDGKTICLSVHFNAYNGRARGTETIHSIFSKPDLATSILNSIVELGLPKRRVFSKKSSRGNFDYYAMHRLTGKAQTIIVEPLFLDNTEDVKILRQEGFLDRLADKYVEGLLNYLNIETAREEQKKKERREKETTKKILDIDEALEILVKHKIINSPDFWKKASSVVKYFDVFIINVANKLNDRE